MYAPHMVSLINRHGDDLYLTVLRGVMVQDLERRAVLQAGDYDASYTKIFIPFGVDARNADGEPVTYLPPRQYAKTQEPEKHWTLQADGEEAGRSSFFVRGEIRHQRQHPGLRPGGHAALGSQQPDQREGRGKLRVKFRVQSSKMMYAPNQLILCAPREKLCPLITYCGR